MIKNFFKSYRGMSIEVKASMWFLICSILQKAISFITVPLFTRLLTDAEYGTYSLFLSWESILTIFATLNLCHQVFNNGMTKYENDRDGYTTSMVGLTLVSCSFFALTFFLLKKPIAQWTNSISAYLPLMFANMFFSAVTGLWIVRKRYEYKYRSLTIMSLAGMILNPALGIFFIRVYKTVSNGRIIGTVFANGFVFFIVIFLLIKRSRRLFSWAYWKYALKLSLPLIPHYLSMVILSSSDRVMIGNYCGKAYTAYYSVASNASMVIQIVLTSINSSFNPWTYQRLKAREHSKIKNTSSSLLILVAALNLLPVLFAPEIISILGSTGYAQAVSIMPALSCSVFMIFLYSLFVNVELFYEKNKLTSLGSAGAAIANIILNIIFIPRFGYEAAAYTTLACYVLLAFFHYIVVRSICRRQKIDGFMYNSRLILILALALFAASFGIRLLYAYSIARYAIILAAAVILIVLRKKIFAVIRSIKK